MEVVTEEALPIDILVGKSLVELFTKIEGIGQRLTAQLNFQAMTCGWFGDEDDIATWHINIDIVSAYDNKRCFFQAEQDELMPLVDLADDACFAHQQATQQLNVLVAITEKELEFLQANTLHDNNKVLKKYLDTKITKVVNLVASSLNLEPLPTA